MLTQLDSLKRSMSAITCQLLVPGILQALGSASEVPAALRTMLRFARSGAAVEGDDHAWRCRLFGIVQQQDWPVAPYASLAEGLVPGPHYWLCAEPVHLLLQRDSFAVAAGADFSLTSDQSGEIVESLNRHFAGDGMLFFAPDPARWYLRLASVPNLQTRPFCAVAGRDIQAHMPRGADALQWHRCLNEIQMLLHDHPVNQHLEQQDRLPVNSLWLWGGGTLGRPTAQPGMTVWANDPLTVGLAEAVGAAPNPLPLAAADWLGQYHAREDHLIVLDRLDASAPPHRLEVLEREWFAPLLEALRAGRLGRLELHLGGTQAVRTFFLTRNDLYKFWRRPGKLEPFLG
jgi:hypothetical protein